MDMPHLVHPFISWWIFGLLPLVSYHECCCCEHLCTSFVQIHIFISIGYIPSGIAGLCGNSIFNFLRNHKIVFQSSCTILHSHQQCMSIPISPHPSCVFLIIVAIVMSMKWYLIVLLIPIFLMNNDVEHLFICLFIGYLYVFFEEISIRIFCLSPILWGIFSLF